MADAPPPGRGRAGRGIRVASKTDEPGSPRSSSAVSAEDSELSKRTPSPSTEKKGRGRGKFAKKTGGDVAEPGTSSTSPTPPDSPTSAETPTPPTASPPPEIVAGMQSMRVATKGSFSNLAKIEGKETGKDGRAVEVSVNYVKLKIKPNTAIYEYHIRYKPDIDSRPIRSKILRREEVSNVIGNVIQFTGVNLYLPKMLEQNVTVIQSSMPTDESPVEVTIEYVKQPPSEELIPFFNTLFRRVMNILKMVQINRHYYMPEGRIEIPQHKLEVWPGWVTAIQEHDGGLLLVCDASHRVLRKSTARDVLQDMHQKGPSGFMENAKKALVGCIVLTRYNNKPYRIDDLAFDQNPSSTFPRSDGTEISYFDYFKTMWNIEIKDMRQPMLIHRPKPKRGQTEEPKLICLVPELSFMTGLTDEIRSDFRAMRDIATHTRIPPSIRRAKLIHFLQSVEQHEVARKVFLDWSMKLDQQPLDCTARLLSSEKLLFGNSKTIVVNEKVDWGRDATNSALIATVPVTKWMFVYTKRDAAKAKDLWDTLVQVTRCMGFTFSPPTRIELADENPATYCTKIREAFTKDMQLIVIMTPGSSQREDRYSAVKKLCCCDLAVPSQVLRCNTVSDPKKSRSVCQKVALQISCKVGGELWAVQMPLKSVMFVGIDVYHDAAQRGKSVVAVVASINGMITRWYSRVFFQQPNEEIVNTLQVAIVACLKKYFEILKNIPERVFVYRDGVGDGQIPIVKNYEVAQLTQAIGDYVLSLKMPSPKLTVIVVQKRINTKIFKRSDRNPNDYENPLPGTVLDTTVTRPFYSDFFLVSQHVGQGTVTPTHYITVHDDSAMPVDRIQRLTYKMTHMYYNWPGTIRVPAPCQYAHKLAYLAGQNLKKVPDESLSDKLFYL